MEKGNTIFYHRHIDANIQRLDERKDKWNSHHISFLEDYCEPLKQKIRHVRSQIQRYQIMRDNQEQIIEQQPDIASILAEVKEYRHTKDYFHSKLNQYEKKSLELQHYHDQLRKQIFFMKKDFKNQQQQLGFQLPFLHQSTIKSNRQENYSRSQQSKSFALPSIKNRNQTESSVASSKVTIRPKKIIDIGQKIQKLRNFRNPSQQIQPEKDDFIIKQEPKNENRSEVDEERKKLLRIRERITKFNKVQTLFHDCFEVKKNSVQRSVSQLQSKLIGNREEFLNTCHAIGSKSQKIDFEIFNKLSSDEVLTLFISFVWLNKKITSQFSAKRKMIMDFIGKLPKIDKVY